MVKLSVLVVEDESFLRTAITAALEKQSHTVTAVENGGSAIRLLQGIEFNVLVTDMLLGEKDGIEVIQAARKHQPGIRIVAMSGGGNRLRPAYLLNLAVHLGAVAPLVKPFTISQLIAAVEGSTG